MLLKQVQIIFLTANVISAFAMLNLDVGIALINMAAAASLALSLYLTSDDNSAK